MIFIYKPSLVYNIQERKLFLGSNIMQVLMFENERNKPRDIEVILNSKKSNLAKSIFGRFSTYSILNVNHSTL